MIYSTRQWKIKESLIGLFAATMVWPVAAQLQLETPLVVENSLTWRTVYRLWNDSRGTVFVEFEDTQFRVGVLGGAQLPLTFPITSQPHGGFVGHRYETNIATRCNPDGSIDATFVTPAVKSGDLLLNDIVCQPDGKILFGCHTPPLASTFQGLNDGLFRLNADGSSDTTFRFSKTRDVKNIILVGNEKILVNCRSAIFRLMSDGSADPTFRPPTFQSGSCEDFGVQPDGHVIVGGNFGSVDGIPQRGLARLNPEGSFDFSFRPSGTGTGGLSGLEVQTDGSIIVFAGRGFARYFSDGTYDDHFFTTITDPNLPSIQLAVDAADRVYYMTSKNVFQLSGRNRIRVPAAEVPVVLQRSAAADGQWTTIDSVPASTASDYLLPNILGPGNAFFRTIPAQ
jgi:uncharacterized delta-60 repeat protein